MTTKAAFGWMLSFSDDNRLCAGCGDADTALTPVELHVVLAHEDITKDPERTIWSRDVNAHEAKDACGTRLLKNEVTLGQGEGLATKCEAQVRKILTAVNCPLLSHEGLGTKLICDGCDVILGACQERGARINDRLLAVRHRAISELNTIKCDLPVGLGAQ